MRLIKLYFIVTLVFGSAICFAGEEEEFEELKSSIFTPIIHNFPDEYSSYSRYLSLGIIEMEKLEGKQFSLKEANDAANELEQQPPLNNKTVQCIVKQTSEYIGETQGEMLYNTVWPSWKNNLASCGNYTDIVLIAFIFNEINNKLLHKPQYFKQTMIIRTTKGTGDHSFVLVEGTSGTIFAVDPWSQKLVALDIFNKWPNKSDLQKNKEALNKLFKVIVKDMDYYDMLYINPHTTSWYLDSEETHMIFDIVTTKNAHIKRFYNALLKTKSFPLWVKSYDDLFQKSDSQAVAETELENKKDDE